jgi:hypothetical protein
MAATINDYVALARQDLADPNPPAALISDADLQRHVLHAVREYELARPREIVETPSVTAGSRAIDLTAYSNLMRVLAAEYPTGQWPPAYVQFQVYGQTLTLALDEAPDGASGASANLYCCERHQVDAGSCTVDPQDDECIVAGTVHFAAQELATRTAGTINLAGPDLWLRYRDLALDKAAEFRGYLTLIRARVTPQRAYAPAEPRQSRFSVEAPWRGG